MRRRRGPVTLLAGLAVPALVAACGSGAATAADGLRVTVEQSRDNENRGLLQLVVHNDGAEPVHVRRVQLRSPGYRGVPPGVFDDQVAPGRRIAFPVPLGATHCDAGTAGSAVVVGLLDGGSVREVQLSVPEQDAVLPRLHARACALERLAEAVDVRFSGDWARAGDAITGTVVLERRSGDDAVRLTDLQSSIVFLLEPAGPLPLELAAGERRVELPVEVRAVRCDPHALIESKRTHTFPVFVSVGGGEALQTAVTADDDARALMDAVLRDRCAELGVDLG